MQCLPEYGFSYLLDDVAGPVVPKHAWYYDASVNDCMLKPIVMLEETTGPTVLVRINGLDFNVPASWYLLVVDEETKIVDTVSITQCSSSAYKAFLMHPTLNKYELASVQLLDLDLHGVCVHLTIPKQYLILHPTGPTAYSGDLPMCCLLGPQDVGKLMGDLSAQEILI
jgi:hypothetical protein